MGNVANLVQLSIDDITVGYDGLPVVQDISLTLGNGQIGCLLGPSGCGKSTLLRAIAGFEPVIMGDITMEGKLLSSVTMTVPPEQRQIGMVFQDLALFPHLSIAENISFGLRGWSTAEKAVRVKELLALVGLPSMENRYPHLLSGGQQQRIALARAMAPKPKLLLLDEPFSGLDASLREVLIPEVRDMLLQENVSVLLVTHDQMEAFAMADKVAVMQAGKIHQCDSAFNIYHEPKTRFVADFVGQGEFLRATIVDEFSVDSALGLLRSPHAHGFVKNQSVDILVRPDDVLHDDDSDVTAEIVTKQFRGSHFLYQVVLPSRQKLYCFASSHHNHALGEAIGIKLDLDHLVMFAESS
ncbi:ABC transporter ATP-binding protein [Candidatus Endobugula sertula]|uniref:ABC transporter ATP-binding protein n=1 Tax=Candidatus Endobugula sertula TaxID=62101 RepID=A0A1D2QNW2_9GAMM|nr:ABC transporter ATP-binding protein [Candidatus Endobugula sertula]